MPEPKLLTVAVPAYNAGATLRACLDSLVSSPALSCLDIVAVDDGSRDCTGDLMEAYAARFPQSVRVVHQENGGHGAGINTAAGLAWGKYFKVLDADDRFVTANLPALLCAMKTASADAVVTPFSTVSPAGGLLRQFPLAGVVSGREYALADFWSAGVSARRCCVFHGLAYRADFYRSCDIALSTHTLYEDQEYATLPFRSVRRVLPLDLPLYLYTVGGADQSVSDSSQVRNLSHLEKVFWVIWEHYRVLPRTADDAVREYFRYKLGEILLSYYAAALLKNPDRKNGRVQARALRERVRERDGELARFAGKRYRLALALHHAGICGKRWAALRQAPGYRLLCRLAH